MTIDKKIEYWDLDQTEKKQSWKYYGKRDMHLEGWIFGLYGDQLKILLTGLCEKDIVATLYHPAPKVYEIYVKQPPPDIERIALSRGVNFFIPAETKKIRVIDYNTYKLPNEKEYKIIPTYK